MLREWFPHLLIVLGIVLVANLLYTFPHAGELRYTYDAERIEYTDDYLRTGGEVDALDCYGIQDPGCLLWTEVAQDGPMTVNTTDLDRFNYGTEYVVVEEAPNDWPFYRRIVESSDRNLTLRLERVTPAEILANVSIEYDDLSDPGQEAVRTGNVTIYEGSLPSEGQVVRFRGDYYLLHRSGIRAPEWESGQARFLRAVFALVGVGLALNGQRRRHT